MNRFAYALTFFALTGCATSTRVSVVRNPPGTTSELESGEEIQLEAIDDAATLSLKPGFYTIRNADEWHQLFTDNSGDRVPPIPKGIDWSRSTLIIVARGDELSQSLDLTHAVDASDRIHIYVSQAIPGKECPKTPPKKVPFRMAKMDRSDKDVQFHLDSTYGTPCGKATPAKIVCAIQGRAQAGVPSPKIGETVECVTPHLATEGAGSPIVDRTWTFAELPQGSVSKMSFPEDEYGLTFPVDLFGRYTVRLEQTDDAGRTSRGTYAVDVDPPNDRVILELVWTRFAPQDDPTTFPRIELHGLDFPRSWIKEPWGVPSRDCFSGAAQKPAWCQIVATGASSQMTIAPGKRGKIRVAVHYTDDRYKDSPIACVHIYRNGDASATACDDQVRKAGAYWEIGVLDAADGSLELAASK